MPTKRKDEDDEDDEDYHERCRVFKRKQRQLRKMKERKRQEYLKRTAMNSNSTLKTPIRGSSVLRGHPGTPQVGTAPTPTPSRAPPGTVTPLVDMTLSQLNTYEHDCEVHQMESSKKDSEVC